MKLQYTLVFLLLTAIVYGQKSTLHQNVNVRANELKHKLNKTEDSLVFKCERTIYEVVIFNDDFERVFKVRDSKAKISIADIPVGRYIIEALLSDKLIVITLLRNESFDIRESTPLITNNTNLFGKKLEPQKVILASTETKKEAPIKAIEKKEAEVTETTPIPEKEVFSNESVINKTDLAVAGKKAEIILKTSKPAKKVAVAEKKELAKSSLSLFKIDTKVAENTPKRSTREYDIPEANRIYSTYWVIYKINNGQSSEKILKMADQETVDRMIRKIKVDMKTVAGRLNELSIWQIYDSSKFVQHKRQNKADYLNVPSESYNMVPYFKKVNTPDNM